MSRLRALICGAARDVEWALPVMRARIERTARLFSDVLVVVVENDSTDGTRSDLESWAAADSRVTILGEDRSWPAWGRTRGTDRMEALAEVRNRFLDHAAELRGLDVALVVDFDLTRGWSQAGLASTFAYEDWDVMASNGLLAGDDDFVDLPPYWDTWAHRSTGSKEPPPFEGPDRLTFEPGSVPIAVDSAFGGLAVYRWQAFVSGARYGGDDCEHVVFHRRLRQRGFGRILLNPSQILIHGAERPGSQKTPSEASSDRRATQRFRRADPLRFVVVSSPRSGTHMLRTALDAHPAITCRAESFNPDLIDDTPYDAQCPTSEVLSTWAHPSHPPAGIRAVGFAAHRSGAPLGNWTDLWRVLEGDREIRILFLHRHDLLRRYVSFLLMQARNRSGNRSLIPEARQIRFEDLRDEFRSRENELANFRRRFAGHPRIQLAYEDLCGNFDATLARCFRFLGVRNLGVSPGTERNPRLELSRIIANFDDLRDRFAGTRWAWFFDPPVQGIDWSARAQLVIALDSDAPAEV